MSSLREMYTMPRATNAAQHGATCSSNCPYMDRRDVNEWETTNRITASVVRLRITLVKCTWLRSELVLSADNVIVFWSTSESSDVLQTLKRDVAAAMTAAIALIQSARGKRKWVSVVITQSARGGGGGVRGEI